MDALDLTSPEGIRAAASLGLGKLNGLCRAAKLGLPVSTHGWVLRTAADAEAARQIFGDAIALCRPDAPEGCGSRLPRGRDAAMSELVQFLDRCQGVVAAAVLLVFPHPTYAIAGKYLARYHTAGATNILVSLGKEIVIEFVGRGFDVGDITRGKSAHSTLRIDWSERFEKPMQWLKSARSANALWNISAANYAQQRGERITELANEFGHAVAEVSVAIPETVPSLSDAILKRIRTEFLDALLAAAESGGLPRVSAAMANLYDKYSYAFELWIPQRSAVPVR